MSFAQQLSASKATEAFLAWDAPPGVMSQPLDGVPLAIAPASPVHGRIQSEPGRLLDNHLADQGNNHKTIANPDIRLDLNKDHNVRIRDDGVTFAALIKTEAALSDPMRLAENPGNARETWCNARVCATPPSIRETLVARSDLIGGHLRSNPDGTWPAAPAVIDPAASAVIDPAASAVIGSAALGLQSIDFGVELKVLYAGTWLIEHAA